jgi:hypothetical protein
MRASIARDNAPTDQWDRYLPYALSALNMSPDPSTGFSPFYLMYGQAPRTAADVYTGTSPELPSGTPSELAQILRDRQNASLDTARAHALQRHLTNKEAHDRRLRPCDFKVGDWVFVHRPADPRRLAAAGGRRKLLIYADGPYAITEVNMDRGYVKIARGAHPHRQTLTFHDRCGDESISIDRLVKATDEDISALAPPLYWQPLLPTQTRPVSHPHPVGIQGTFSEMPLPQYGLPSGPSLPPALPPPSMGPISEWQPVTLSPLTPSHTIPVTTPATTTTSSPNDSAMDAYSEHSFYAHQAFPPNLHMQPACPQGPRVTSTTPPAMATALMPPAPELLTTLFPMPFAPTTGPVHRTPTPASGPQPSLAAPNPTASTPQPSLEDQNAPVAQLSPVGDPPFQPPPRPSSRLLTKRQRVCTGDSSPEESVEPAKLPHLSTDPPPSPIPATHNLDQLMESPSGTGPAQPDPPGRDDATSHHSSLNDFEEPSLEWDSATDPVDTSSDSEMAPLSPRLGQIPPAGSLQPISPTVSPDPVPDDWETNIPPDWVYPGHSSPPPHNPVLSPGRTRALGLNPSMVEVLPNRDVDATICSPKPTPPICQSPVWHAADPYRRGIHPQAPSPGPALPPQATRNLGLDPSRIEVRKAPASPPPPLRHSPATPSTGPALRPRLQARPAMRRSPYQPRGSRPPVPRGRDLKAPAIRALGLRPEWIAVRQLHSPSPTTPRSAGHSTHGPISDTKRPHSASPPKDDSKPLKPLPKKLRSMTRTIKQWASDVTDGLRSDPPVLPAKPPTYAEMARRPAAPANVRPAPPAQPTASKPTQRASVGTRRTESLFKRGAL